MEYSGKKPDAAGLINQFPSLLSNLGVNYYLMNMLDSVIYFHQQAWTLAEELNKPSDMADALNNLGNVYYELFTDFFDFTPISKTPSPEKLDYFLNQYFSAFDELLAKYGLEKIKTIGDSYMCASGLISLQKKSINTSAPSAF